MALKIRKDDMVKVISGKSKGRTGRVLRVDVKNQRVYVEGANIHQAPPAPDHSARHTARKHRSAAA
jgi:large subunit ribosomal protein L24